jgi:hypothetical protein
MRAAPAWILALGLIVAGPAVAAEREEVGIRLLAEYIDDEHDLRQQAVFVRWRPDRARRLRWEAAVGTLHEGSHRAFVSGGPLWRFTPGQDRQSARFVIDFGIHPTLLSKSRFSNVDLGGVFQFTSFLSAGARLGPARATRVALRVQHISNAGIYDKNPGTDQLGLELSHRF